MIKTKEVSAVNLGLEILRVLLCLWIVIVHCAIPKKGHVKFLKKGFHVPTFILMSFYFYYRTISSRIINKITLRFQRLLIPYILWPLIIFILNNSLFKVFSVGIVENKLNIKDIYIQILIGARYHGIFWFQFNLIFLSLYFTIISFIFKENMLEIIQISGAISFYLHISGINFNFFRAFNWAFALNTGYIVELMPLAVFGIIFGSIRLLQKTKKCSLIFHLLMVFFLYVLFNYDLFISLKGFKYPNTLLHIIASTTLVITFASFPLEKISSQKVKLIIKKITQFTGGIYYLHPRIKDILQKISPYLNKRKTYCRSFFIYILCYFICFIGNNIFINTKLK